MGLKVGIVCYPSIGGSGVVATEIGLAMARAGHVVHFISTGVPTRLDPDVDNVFVHQVRTVDYPVFPQTPYSLGLASTIASVARHDGLDVVHAHYAVPHATAAWMAREINGNGFKVVTTLHGTDITLIGRDEGYLPITRHSILRSDAVTTPSAYLRDETWAQLDLSPGEVPIEVIPNFVDPDVYQPLEGPDHLRMTALFGPEAAHVPVLAHVSNFRQVKNVPLVVDVFEQVVAQQPAFLLLVGDGPERARVESMLRQRGLADRARLLGAQSHVAPLVREAALFLLPSSQESFGLAALEALASGVPVVAFGVGGIPEVVEDGRTGFLVPPGDVEGMVARVNTLLRDASARQAMGARARVDAVARFRQEPVVARYEALYRRLARA